MNNAPPTVPAVISALYYVGHVENLGGGAPENTVAIALETESRTFYLKDSIPPPENCVTHRLACAVTRFSLRLSDVAPSSLLGQPVLIDCVPSETFAALRSVKPFPRASQSASLFPTTWTTRDSRLVPGASSDNPLPCGGVIRKFSAPLPIPPTPRSSLIQWDVVADLTEPVLPSSLPAIVVELVRRSREFERLLEMEQVEAAVISTAPTRRRRP